MTVTFEIRMDLSSPTPACHQIVDALRLLLVDHKLRPGDALPSARRLAPDLGVHFNTIAGAYRQLAADGWLDVRRGRKAFVLDRSTPTLKTEDVQIFQNRLRSIVVEAQAKGMSPSKVGAELRSLAAVYDKKSTQAKSRLIRTKHT